MTSSSDKYFRILAVSPSMWGFGFVVLEGKNTLVDWDAKGTRKDKSDHCLQEVDRLMKLYAPGVVVLFDHATEKTRSVRIQKLNQRLITLVKKRKIKTTLITKSRLRQILCPDSEGTNHEIAQVIADKFPDALSFRLPPKRRAWMNQDRRMDIFDAAALAVAFRQATASGSTLCQ